MRLVEIRSILRVVIDDLIVVTAGDGAGNIRVSNFRRALHATEQIKGCGLFIELCNEVLLEPLRLAAVDAIVITSSANNGFATALNSLRGKATALLDVLEEAIPQQDPLSVSLRLPDNQALGDMVGLFKNIDQAFNQLLVNPHINGNFKLLAFDRGSFWMELAFNSSVALAFVTNVLRVYHEDRERRVKIKSKESLYEDFQSDMELRDKVRKHYEDLLELELENAKSGVRTQFKIPDDDYEYIGRFNVAFKQLSEMLNNGLEVHPALLEDIPAAEILMPNGKRLIQAGQRLLVNPPDEPESQEPENGDNVSDTTAES